MIERRIKRDIYFKEQDLTTEKYVVPYLEKFVKIDASKRVLEIGCGEGGNLKYFIDAGCEVLGLDLNLLQIDRANELVKELCKDVSRTKFIHKNIYDTNAAELGQFDLVIMRDVIEHIPNQEKFLGFLRQFVKPEGFVYFGFPPWYMPFGGHQQGCKSILKKTPYFHILPIFLYKSILFLFGEADHTIKGLLETKSTGISIERFRKICKQNSWNIKDETLYLINPNYEIKFKLKPRVQFGFLAALPFFRNFVTTCAYYIISPNKS